MSRSPHRPAPRRERLWPVSRTLAHCALVFAALILPTAHAEAEPLPGQSAGEARSVDLLGRVARALDTHVIPAFEKLAEETRNLTAAIDRYCEAPDTASREGVEAAFAAVVRAWSAAEHLRFGPLGDQGRAMHIHFWPDPRGVTDRQMRRVLNKRDPGLLDPDTLARQSVAILGLGAIEYVILANRRATDGEPAPEQHGYACRYARESARLVEREAATIASDWTAPGGWRTRLLEPHAGAEIYRSADESAAQLVKALLLGLQIVRDQRVLPLYDLARGQTTRAKVPFQRLGLGDEAIRASLASLRQLNDALALDDHASGPTAWVKPWTRQGFLAVDSAAGRLQIPESAKLEAEDIDLSVLRRLRFYVNGLRQVIARQTAPSAGLTIGFNELDGD